MEPRIVCRMGSATTDSDGVMGSLEAQGCFNEKGEPFLRIVTDDGDIVELQDEKIIKPIYALIRQFHDLLESALTEVEGGRH